MARLNDCKVAFMGQTGRGKSTLINSLFGTDYRTDSVVECTTFINSATFINRSIPIQYDAYTIMDSPGIGASQNNDILYEPYYQHILETADCVVWLSNMQRTDRLDQLFMLNHKKLFRSNMKFIICINQVDIISPQYFDDNKMIWDVNEEELLWDDLNNSPSPLLSDLIYNKRIPLVSEKLGKYIPIPFSVSATNALKNWGIQELKNQIFSI